MIEALSYIQKDSAIHHMDARVKLIVLLVFSITLFCMSSSMGIAVFVIVLLFALLASRVSLVRYMHALAPAAFILFFIWLCNSIPFELERSLTAFGYIVRIALVIIGSFVIAFTATSTELTDAFTSLLRPLRALRVPVDDVAFTLSLAIRFIPLVFEQLSSIKIAQRCRGAQFSTGPLWSRLKTWAVVLLPLFVGFFRHADTTAEAMDARCYGAKARTSLGATKLGVTGWLTLMGAILFCCACVVIF